MSNTINWASADTVTVNPLVPSQTAELTSDDDSVQSSLVLDGGGGYIEVIEGNLEALRKFERKVTAAIVELEQRLFEQRTAFRRGEHVRIGKGRKEWVIDRFTTMGSSSALYAVVSATDGYASQSALIANLSGWDS
jgi:hypothetical protein